MVGCLFDGAKANTRRFASAPALAAVPAPRGWAGGRRVTMEDDKARLARLVAEYERLRKLLHELDVQANTVDGRLIEVERELPETTPATIRPAGPSFGSPPAFGDERGRPGV